MLACNLLAMISTVLTAAALGGGEMASREVAGKVAVAEEVREVIFASQFGLTYLPFMVMNERDTVEKNSKAAGLAEVKAEYKTLSGPAPINDALLSASAQFGAVGVPSLVQLWDRTKGDRAVKTIGAMTSAPMFLNTTRPEIKSVLDFTEKDRIALPSIRVSVQAVTLQMAVAKAFGNGKFNQLDKLTVAMSHPDGTQALLGGSGGITAHFTAPPFQYQQLKSDRAKVSRVLSSYDVLGGKSTFVVAISTERFAKASPKVFKVVCDSLAETQEWINANKKEAAEIYLKATKSKETVEEILAQMNDPDIEYTVVPMNIQKYADFMLQTGAIKTKAASWKDLCFPHLHDKPGS